MDPSGGTPGRSQVTAMTPAVTVPGQPQPPPTQYYVVTTRHQTPIHPGRFQAPIGTSSLPVNPQTSGQSSQGQASPTATTAAAPTVHNKVLSSGLPPTQPQQPEQGQVHLQLEQQQGQFLKQNQGSNPGPVITIPLRRPRLPQQQMSIGIPKARFQNQQFVIVKRPLQMSNQTEGPSTSMELQKTASNPTGHNQLPNVQLSQDQDLKQAPIPTISMEAGLSNPNLLTKRDQDETVQLAQDPNPMEPPTASIPRKSKKSKKKKKASHPGNLPNQTSGSSQPLTAINALEEHVVQHQVSSPDSSVDMFSRASKVHQTECGRSEGKEKNVFTIDIGEVMGMAGITLDDCEYDPSVNYPYMQAPDGSITQSAPTDVELFARDWDYMFEMQASATGEQIPLQSPTQQALQGPNQMLQLQEPSQEETAFGSLPTMQMKLSELSLFPSPMEPPSSEQEEVIDDIKGESAGLKGSAESMEGVRGRGRRSRKSPVKPCALSQEMEYTISEGPPSPPHIPSTKAAKKRAARKKKQGTLPKPTQSNGSSSKERGMPGKISSNALVVQVSETPQTQNAKMRTSTSPRNKSKTAAPALSVDFATPTAPLTKSSSEQDDVVTVTSNPTSQQPTTSKAAVEPISSPSPMEPPSSEQEEVIDDIKGDSASLEGSAESKQGGRPRRSRKSPVKPCVLSQEIEYTISEGPPSPPQIPSTKAAKKRAALKKKQRGLPKPTQSNASLPKGREISEKISSNAFVVVEVSETPQTPTQKAKMRTSTSPRNKSKTAAPALSADFATPTAPLTKSSSEQDDVVTVTSNPTSQQATTSKAALEPTSSPSPTRRVTRALARKINPANASSSETGASGDGGVTQELKVSTEPLGNPQQPLGEQITIKLSAQPTGNAAEGAVLRQQVAQGLQVSGTPNPSLSNQVTPYWKIVPLTGNGTETPRFAFMPTQGPGEGHAQLVVQVQDPAGSAVDVPVGPDSSTADKEWKRNRCQAFQEKVR